MPDDRTDDAALNLSAAEARLRAALARHEGLAIAVSGGVDSMTLAYLAHRWMAGAVMMVHAVSPAVPSEATARVRSYAERERWVLVVTGAGEFDDPSYRANPVDRCYYCKSNLYDRIRTITSHVIASGANLDDLDDYRPGLVAAAERQVVHPYIEAGIDKRTLRELAQRHGLTDIAELPAQPCLSSRVETGIAIDAGDLEFVHEVETALAAIVPQGVAVRCRITHRGVVVELAAEGMTHAARAANVIERMCARDRRVFGGVRAYRRGAAFLKIATA